MDLTIKDDDNVKIGIVGNYGNDNNGDEAILLSIIRQLQKAFNVDTTDITVFSNNPTQTAERYNVQSAPLYIRGKNAALTFAKTFRKNTTVVKKLDFLVIGGGGILMDLYKREAPLYGSYAMMAHSNNVPYVVYGCGAGPLTSTMGQFFIRFMCKHAQNISVRDPKSEALLKSIGVQKDIFIIGDPAFSLEADRTGYSNKPLKIGVTAVPYHNGSYWPSSDEEKYNNYITGMAKNLDKIIEKFGVEIQFYATKYPQDADVTKDIQKLMKNPQNTNVLEENLPPQRLLEVSSELDVVIGTRLHSLILATDAKTPLIAVSYHNKVNDFMQMAGLGDYSIDIEELHKRDDYFERLVTKMDNNWPAAIRLAKDTNSSFKNKAEYGLYLLREGMEQQ
ncbi:MAG: polysaccharide pyruvyl transferase family protein [Lysinibacillus sp.]